MIEYSPRFQNMEISCDEVDCGHSIEFYGTFDECVALAKSSGWKISPDGDDWIHTCPDCVEFNLNNLERYGQKN